MSAFSLNITTLKAAYDQYVTNSAAVADAEQAIVDLGAIPDYPNVVTTNSAYNDVTALRTTWQTNYDGLMDDLKNAKDAARSSELVVLNQLGWVAAPSIPATGAAFDQWVRVVGAGGGILTYTHWIGCSETSTYLTVSTTQPTQDFPNI